MARSTRTFIFQQHLLIQRSEGLLSLTLWCMVILLNTLIMRLFSYNGGRFDASKDVCMRSEEICKSFSVVVLLPRDVRIAVL